MNATYEARDKGGGGRISSLSKDRREGDDDDDDDDDDNDNDDDAELCDDVALQCYLSLLMLSAYARTHTNTR